MRYFRKVIYFKKAHAVLSIEVRQRKKLNFSLHAKTTGIEEQPQARKQLI